MAKDRLTRITCVLLPIAFPFGLRDLPSYVRQVSVLVIKNTGAAKRCLLQAYQHPALKTLIKGFLLSSTISRCGRF